MSSNPIQFRAWNGHKMCRVDSISFNAGGMIWHGPGEFGWGWVDETFEGWTPDNPKPEVVYPVMRWTGLRDKEGTKIWEGDVMRVKGFTELMEVRCGEWDDCNNLNHGTGFYAYGQEWGGWALDSQQTLEVIGDIYSNPDLLKS